jgi:hypothetical protein
MQKRGRHCDYAIDTAVGIVGGQEWRHEDDFFD